MKFLLSLVLVLALSTAAFGAEAEKPLSDLIMERRAAYAEVEKLKKENDQNVAAFNKLPEAVKFNAQQQVLQARFQKVQAKLIDLNSKIADAVSKGKETK